MTRESLKRAIDYMPDKDFDALTSAITTLYAFVGGENPLATAQEEDPKWERKKIPENITSITQLFGTLPPSSLTAKEIKGMRLADREKRLSE
jgi:hypothetical protein